MTTQDALWIGAGAMLALAVASALAEGRRSRRRDLDSPGWMPWAPIQILAGLAALIAAALALKG